MDCFDGVFCLVVADHLDFVLAGIHQGYDLPWSPHKRLAEAVEFDLADWVDHPNHRSGLSIEQHPIAAGLQSAYPAQDGYVLGIELREDWVGPRREVWDIYQNPCLRAHP